MMRVQMVVTGASLTSRECDKLAEWLSQPPVPTEDPLHWWLANRKLYPHLSQMAVDVHTTPGMFFGKCFLMLLTVLSSNGCRCGEVLQPWTNPDQPPLQSSPWKFYLFTDVLWRLVLSPAGLRFRACSCPSFQCGVY